MARAKGSKMTEEQKAAMRAKRAANKLKKESVTDSRKAINDAFKHLYSTIETHAGSIGEESREWLTSKVSDISIVAGEKIKEAQKKAIEIAEENVRKAEKELEKLRGKYGDR